MEMIYTRPVHFYELDQMGIVHHANYIHFFEEARLDAMSRLGFGYERLMDAGLASPVMNLSCEYLAPSRYPDILEVHILLKEYDGVRFRFSYQIKRQSDSMLICRGESQHCLIAGSGLPVRIRSRYPEIHALMHKWLLENPTEPTPNP